MTRRFARSGLARRHTWLALAAGTLAAALLLGGCAAPRSAASRPGGLPVVATFSVLGDFVHAVGRDKIELRTLVGPGQDTHTFDPTPGDSAALARAALVFENGFRFETWLDDLYAASGSKAERVVATGGVAPRRAAAGEADPHAWHSAANAAQMVKNIGAALARADPAEAAFYRANAEAYVADLQELDAWIFDQARGLPEARRKLVTTHDTLGYFAERYGFEVVGTVLPASTEGASPSAQQVAALVEAVRAAGVPALFAENVAANTLLRQVADEAGVAVVTSLYTDALGPAGSDGETYLKMMRYNVTTIVSALDQ